MPSSIEYRRCLEFLYRGAPNYQVSGNSAIQPGLHNITRLCSWLGHPQKKFPSIHVAGTNGKGTSAHAIAAILQTAGYRTGLFTSPHLCDFRERIKIDGKPVDEELVTGFVAAMRRRFPDPPFSFFEITTALAFQCFHLMQVDIGVVEVGMGGRLDSTNILDPVLALITSISGDHREVLGFDLRDIAREKAGIIPRDGCVVVGQHQIEVYPVFEQAAKALGAEIVVPPDPHLLPASCFGREASDAAGRVSTDLKARYFHLNLPGVLEIIHQLRLRGWKIEERHSRLGIENLCKITGLRGRYETISEQPRVIADVSHNPEGMRLLIHQVEQEHSCFHVILSVKKSKPLVEILQVLPKGATYHFVRSQQGLSHDPVRMEATARSLGLGGRSYPDFASSLSGAIERYRPGEAILITGGHFLVGEALSYFGQKSPGRLALP